MLTKFRLGYMILHQSLNVKGEVLWGVYAYV